MKDELESGILSCVDGYERDGKSIWRVLRDGDALFRQQGDVYAALHRLAQRGIEPIRGTPDELADAFRAYAREGIAHLQLVLDPVTLAAIEELAPALQALDRG